jgi:DNA-binding NarL/FixJ family response regulator
MKRLRVLLVEDHETVRDGLRLLFEAQGDVEVVGDVADGATATAAVSALVPDVVVLDLSMPGMSGLSVATAIRAQSPGVAIVVLTRHNDQAYVQELLAAGALGYVLKQSPFAELMHAIRAAAAGTVHLDSAIRRPLAEGAVRGTRAHDAARPLVTGREMEVLRLSATGRSNKEVAATLAIAIKTVEVHKSSAMRKLQLHDRAEMLRFAALKGWLDEL